MTVRMIEIEYAREAVHAGIGECFEVAKLETHDDGRAARRLHVIPKLAVASRMAEYGVSQAEAVRILLAEPYLPAVEGMPPVLAEPVWRDGAALHRGEVQRVMATLGFTPLDSRVDDRPIDPTALLRRDEVSAKLVSDVRMRIADLRQALREPQEDRDPHAAPSRSATTGPGA